MQKARAWYPGLLLCYITLSKGKRIARYGLKTLAILFVAADFEVAHAAGRRRALNRGSSVFHRCRFRIFCFTRGFALHAIRFRHQAASHSKKSSAPSSIALLCRSLSFRRQRVDVRRSRNDSVARQTQGRRHAARSSAFRSLARCI